jgi:hypothetical protein
MPPKAEGNLFVTLSTEFQSNGCSDAVGMRDDAKDIHPKLVSPIWVGPDACLSHDFRYVIVPKKRKAFLGI